MKQKFLILAYNFEGRFNDYPYQPSQLKTYIALGYRTTTSELPGGIKIPYTHVEGPLIHATCNTLLECETFLRDYKGYDALFVLPIFELEKK